MGDEDQDPFAQADSREELRELVDDEDGIDIIEFDETRRSPMDSQHPERSENGLGGIADTSPLGDIARDKVGSSDLLELVGDDTGRAAAALAEEEARKQNGRSAETTTRNGVTGASRSSMDAGGANPRGLAHSRDPDRRVERRLERVEAKLDAVINLLGGQTEREIVIAVATGELSHREAADLLDVTPDDVAERVAELADDLADEDVVGEALEGDRLVDERKILRLAADEEITQRTAADVLEVSPATVEQRVNELVDEIDVDEARGDDPLHAEDLRACGDCRVDEAEVDAVTVMEKILLGEYDEEKWLCDEHLAALEADTYRYMKRSGHLEMMPEEAAEELREEHETR